MKRQDTRSVPPAVAGGCSDCRLAIADFGWYLVLDPGARRQRQNPPATAGGTDFIPL